MYGVILYLVMMAGGGILTEFGDILDKEGAC